MKSHDVLRTGYTDEQPNYDSGEREKSSRKLSENDGGYPEESIGVFYTPVEQIVSFRRKKKQF